MRRGILVLFTLGLIGFGVYGAHYFSHLRKAEALINQAIIRADQGDYPGARDLLAEAGSLYNYRIVAGPSLYLIGDTYLKEGNYESAFHAFKSLASDERIAVTDRWLVQSVLAISKLSRRGIFRVSDYQAEALRQSLEKIVSALEEATEVRRDRLGELSDELDVLGRKLLEAGFDLHVREIPPEELMAEAKTELGLLLIERKEYDKAKKLFEQLRTPLGNYGLARVYIETGEQRRGFEILEELLRFDRTGALRAYYLGAIYEYGEDLLRQKKFPEAMRAFDIVSRQGDSTIFSELSLYTLALYYYSTRQYSDAMSYTEKTLSNEARERDEDALLLQGYIHYDRRDFVKALKAFNSFMNRFPHSEKIEKAREWKAMCERSIKYLG